MSKNKLQLESGFVSLISKTLFVFNGSISNAFLLFYFLSSSILYAAMFVNAAFKLVSSSPAQRERERHTE